MPTIATLCQTRWPDCYEPSERVKLTLRTNGEETPKVITPQGSMVDAGFDAPTVAASPASPSSGGSLTNGYTYYYVYVYASTKYPYVENAQTVAGGELWPRSNPSPISSAATIAASPSTSRTVVVTVTKTERADVDKILLYRTVGHSSAAEALTAAQAGQYYYIAQTANNGVAGTTTITDNGIVSTGELIELDNYTPDTGWFSVFDGTYWWMAGSPLYRVGVTLQIASSTVEIDSGEPNLYSGRNGQIATFFGLTSGGFDGNGSFYVGVDDFNTLTLYEDPDLTTPLAVTVSGTTTMTITGRASVLYRSKPFNPLSWGLTEQIINADDGSTTLVPQSFALEMGGGAVTAMAVLNNGKLLKIDFENPQRTVTYDLSFAESDTFGATEKIIDTNGSITSHFSQFQGIVNNQPTLLGLDTYNGNVLACDGFRQVILSSILGQFISGLDRTGDVHRFFHGNYDPATEMNCWWVRYYDTADRLNVLIWNHSQTGYWGWTPDFNVSCSATCLDSENNEKFLLGGSQAGHIGRLFDSTYYDNWMNGLGWRDEFPITSVTIVGGDTYRISIAMDYSLLAGIIGQPISSPDETAGTFTTSGTPQCAVGDTVYLVETGSGSFPDHATVQVLSIDGNNVTTEPWSGFPDVDSMFVAPSRMDGLWSVAYNTSETNQVYVQFSFVEYTDLTTLVLDVVEYLPRGTTEIQTGIVTLAPDIIVSGAGDSSVNGTFTFRGTLGGKNYYNLTGEPDSTSSFAIYWNSGEASWFISNDAGDLYFSTDDVATPDLVTTWVDFGVPPVPTVIADYPIQVGSIIGFGCIAAYARAYFDLDSPTQNKKSTELWLTAENVDPHNAISGAAPAYQLAARQYIDFDENSSEERTFPLNRDSLVDGTLTNVWFTHSAVPTTELKQMGFEMNEVGFDNFTLFNFTVKLQETT